MIDLDKLRKSEGYMLAIVNTKTGEYKPVSEDMQVVRHGKWIYKSNSYAYGIPEYECDQCGYWMHEKSKYCPECGARMDEK